ncbi:ABC transporter transmembrane domain-containing protein [Teredinibacter haidensis]|uniref:ABC transporter transmembrane domain-containing protein n=1 Tax=Teredinibacter haidensis TaxID=2731755 RepID=UPI000948BE59|nr:ABC transporter transmembrane domain-containing protein [Teredinibacter haidensis]
MTESSTASSKTNKSLYTLWPIVGFVRPYTKRAIGAVIALVFVAAISLSIGQAVKLVIDEGFVAQSESQLAAAIGLMSVLIFLMAAGTFIRFYLMSWMGERVSADIRKAVFERLISLHPSYFEENLSGEIMSRLTTDTTLLQSIIGSSFSMALRSALTLVGGLVMLLITNIKLSLIVLSGIPFVLLPMVLFGRRVRSLSRKSQDSVADVGAYAGEIIQNIKIVQSYTREREEKIAFGDEVNAAFEIARKRIRQRASLIAVVILLVFTAISMMLWVGGTDVMRGNMSAGDLGAFVFYAIMVSMSLGTLSEVYGELQRAAGAAERLMELLSVEPQIKSPNKPQVLNVGSATSALEFNKLSFSYPSRPEQLALKNIQLNIKKGETIALVGPSGAGKTTLFELLERFYDPLEGEVRVFGCALKTLNIQAARQTIGLVPQQPILFSADVWHNIRYGRPEASDEEVQAAARQAHAHQFIQALPQGYGSFLGEQGVRLSGGQKQRIAIARAILKDPAILLLDEATSALDAESEQHVQAALNDLMKNRTTLIIAHRLSTVIHADRIVLLDNGCIVKVGTHLELLATSPLYKRLCDLQFRNG